VHASTLGLDDLSAEDVERWRALAAEAAEPNPFFEPDYVLPAVRLIGGRGLALMVVWEADGWLACLPVHRPRTWHRVPFRSVATWQHRYCFLGTPLVRSDREEAAAAALVGALIRQRRTALVGLDSLADEGPVGRALKLAAPGGGNAVRLGEHERALLRRGGEDGGRVQAGGGHRREFARKRRRLEDELGTTLELVDRAEEDQALDDFLELEAAGWKGRSGTALASVAADAGFFREVCRSFRELGRLHLLSLQAGGRPLAMACNLRAGEGIFCLKISFDERWRRYSPGAQLVLDHVSWFQREADASWMDSCVEPENELVNRLWPDARRVDWRPRRSAGSRAFAKHVPPGTSRPPPDGIGRRYRSRAMATGGPGNGERAVGVSVLTPTLNEEEHLTETVSCLQAQRLDEEVEFLFMDGRSDDATRSMLERLARDDPRIRILDNPDRRIPSALNLGLRSARGEFIARMDAHTLYPPDYLARGLNRLRRGDVAWVSGPQLPHGAGKWSRRVALALGTRLGSGGAAFRNAKRELEVDAGYTGMWRREMLLRHGGWDVSWPINEDGELAARIRRDGGRIVCIPEMASLYVPRDSLKGLARQYWRYGVYRAKTCRAHPESMRRSHLLPPALTVAVLMALVPRRGASSLARAGLGTYLAASGATAVSRLRRGAPDACFLPLILAIMHLSWGLGFLVGAGRFGPPVRAIALLARPSRGSSRSES
jgi:succinoglycan biosynthesis protein ExoA